VRAPKLPDQGRLGPLFSGYVVMLAVIACFAVLFGVNAVTQGGVKEDEQYWALFAVEVLMGGLVIGVAALVGRIPPHPSPSGHRVAAWLGGFPILAVLLALNIGFGLFLRKLFPNADAEAGPTLTLITMLLICLQPAVFEEWFFRHLALGSLREKWGVHWGVVVSGAMFAFAHLTNPIGMPYLCLLGVCLGYLRVWSGSLLLPMILHFVHNAVVLMVPQWL
jgi:membrane protease YdiL (CAAX protease family)